MSENLLNFARFGCYHTSCGRVLRNRFTAAIEDPAMDHPAPVIEPVQHVIEGARAYAHMRGMADPHAGIDYHKVGTNRDLISSLGHAYDALPNHDPSALSHFHAMRDEVNKQYDHLTNHMGIRAHFVDRDPYPDVHALADDVRNNHRIQVLKTSQTGSHPVFSDDENDKFRAVHDVFGHLGTGRDFDRHGEEAAYQAHARMFPEHARGALASETRGQNGSLIVNSHFGPQKIALMPRRLWHPGLATDAALVDDFRNAQHAQWLREQHTSGGNETERRQFYDTNSGGERKLSLRDWLGHSRQNKGPDEEAQTREYGNGYNLGRRHAELGRVDGGELEFHSARSAHPQHFDEGYQTGLGDTLDANQRIAVHHGFSGSVPLGFTPEPISSFKIVAHVSGNSIDVLHCPFCGSGAVIARSDGTIECNYCTSVFTVQVQPQYPAFPMTSEGQPYAWPGQPDPATVVTPGGAPPMPGDPMAMGAGGAPADIAAPSFSGLGPTDGTGGDPDAAGGDGGPPWAQGDDEDGTTAQVGGKNVPPFAKKDDKKGKDDKGGKKGDNPFAKKKSYLTSVGTALPEDEYIRHLAILHSANPAQTAAKIKALR